MRFLLDQNRCRRREIGARIVDGYRAYAGDEAGFTDESSLAMIAEEAVVVQARVRCVSRSFLTSRIGRLDDLRRGDICRALEAMVDCLG